MIFSRTLRRLSERSRVAVAAALRAAGDVAHRAAERLATVRSAAPAAPDPIVEHVVGAFAAAMPLPAAPPPHGDPAIDVASLITYQTALAEHAKRGEQFRALAALVAHLAR